MVSWAPRLPPAVSGSGARCGRVCWARVSPVPSPSWLGCRGVFFSCALVFSFLFFFFRALWSLSLNPLSFGLGWWLSLFFFFFVSLFPVVRCYWLGVAGFGWVVPLCLCGGPFFFFSLPSGGGAGVGLAMYTMGSAPLLAGLGPGSAGWAAAPGGCLWFWVRGLGLFVSLPFCGAGCNLLGGPSPLSPGALWPRVWPAVLVCGVVARRLPGCAVAGFG